MSRFKEIFSQRPERMSTLVKWVFGLPLSYIFYLALSLLLPNVNTSNNAIIFSQTLRSALLVLCLLLVVKYFLKVSPKRIICSGESFNWNLFFKGFLLMLVVLVVTNICQAIIFQDSIEKSVVTDGRIINWTLSFLLVVVAAFSEELMFRSYIAWFGDSNNSSKKIFYCLVSASLFTVAHFSNPEVEKSAVWSMLFYFITGFSFMLFFLKTKGMEFSLGVHIANNLFSAWIINYSSSVLQTQSLFVSKMEIGFLTILQAVLCMLFCTIFCPNKGKNNE